MTAIAKGRITIINLNDGKDGVTYWCSPGSVLIASHAVHGQVIVNDVNWSQEIEFHASVGNTELTAGVPKNVSGVPFDADMNFTTDVGNITLRCDGIYNEGIFVATVSFTDAKGSIYTHVFSVSVKGIFSGRDGTDGYSLSLSDNNIVLDTDENGIVTSVTGSTPATCTVTVMKGGTARNTKIDSVTASNCIATFTDDEIDITSISSEIIDGMVVSKGSGYVNFTATDTDDGITLGGKVYFTVNLYKVTSSLVKDSKSITESVTTLRKGLDTTNGNLEKTESKLSVRCDGISMSIGNISSEKTNLIPNSMLHAATNKYGDLCSNRTLTLLAGDYVLSANGHASANLPSGRFLHVNIHHPGWTGFQDGLNFTPEGAAACGLSAFDKTHDTTLYKKITITEDGTYIVSVFDYSVDGSADTSGGYVVCNWVNLTRGSTFTNWSPCSSDRINENLAPSELSGWSTHNGLMMTVNNGIYLWTQAILSSWSSSKSYLKGDAVEYSGKRYVCLTATATATPSNASYWKQEDYRTDMLMNNFTLLASEVYTVSFYASGTGKLQIILSSPPADGFVSSQGEGMGGSAYLTLLGNVWKKYSVTFTNVAAAAAYLIIGGLNRFNARIRDVKFENSGMATEGVDEAGLLATGINVRKGEIELTSNNTVFKSNNGEVLAVLDGEGVTSKALICLDKTSGTKLCTINEHGDGLRINYYPGSTVKLREERYVYDNSGDCSGIRIIYYKKDGTVSYIFNESGEVLKSYSGWSVCKIYKSDNITDGTFSNANTMLQTNTTVSDYISSETSMKDYVGRRANGSLPTTTAYGDVTSWFTGYEVGLVCFMRPGDTVTDGNGNVTETVEYVRMYKKYVNGYLTESGEITASK